MPNASHPHGADHVRPAATTRNAVGLAENGGADPPPGESEGGGGLLGRFFKKG